MKYLKFFCLSLFVTIIITSCGKKNKLGKMIPKEAAVVVEFNTKSILSKLSWDDIKKSYWYNQLMTDTSIPATSKAFIDDPAKTGVDIKSNMIFVIVRSNNNGQAIFQGSLKDDKLFSAFLKNMHPDGVISRDGELNIYKTPEAIVGWNNERFAFVTNAEKPKFMDSTLQDSTINRLPIAPLPSDSLLSICKKLFLLNDDNSLYKNGKFANLLDEDGEIHFWVNNYELSKGSMPDMPGMAAMVKLDKFLENNISTGTINFQDGKITGTQKQYFGKELSDIMKKGEGNINADMIKRLPSQNLAGVYAMHFTPGNLLEIIKLTGLDGFISMFLSTEGLSLDDIVRATRGDVVFAVSDINTNLIRTDTINLQGETNSFNVKPDPAFLFAVAVGDKDAFNKLLNFTKKMSRDSMPQKTFQKTDDKYFVISNSQDAVNKYFSGTQINHDFLSKINDHPMGGFVDIQMILKSLQSELTKDSTGQFYYNRNIAMWNNLYFTGGEFKNGGLVYNGEVNLVDKASNSLQQLNKYIDDISKVMIEEKKKRREQFGNDTPLSKLQPDAVPPLKKKPFSKKRK